MPTSIADYLIIDSTLMDALGVFNGLVDLDTPVFVDPRLLKRTTTPELLDSYVKVQSHFAQVSELLRESTQMGDQSWTDAAQMMNFPELPGMCIGYCLGGTRGHGVAEGIHIPLLDVAQKIIRNGVTEPEIFEIMHLLVEDIGPDRVSDIIANIIVHDLCRYTQRVCDELQAAQVFETEVRGEKYRLPKLEWGENLILLPVDILNNLPGYNSLSNIGNIAADGTAARSELIRILSEEIGKTDPNKAERLMIALKHPSFVRMLIDAHNRIGVEAYDFGLDPDGLLIWYNRSVEIVDNLDFTATLSSDSSCDEVISTVLEICMAFKRAVDGGMYNSVLFSDSDFTNARRQPSSRMSLFMLAAAICRRSGLSLRYSITSSGKTSISGFASSENCSVSVETLVSSNTRLNLSFRSMFKRLGKLSGDQRGVIIVIDVGNRPVQSAAYRRWTEFQQLYKELGANESTNPRVIVARART